MGGYPSSNPHWCSEYLKGNGTLGGGCYLQERAVVWVPWSTISFYQNFINICCIAICKVHHEDTTLSVFFYDKHDIDFVAMGPQKGITHYIWGNVSAAAREQEPTERLSLKDVLIRSTNEGAEWYG